MTKLSILLLSGVLALVSPAAAATLTLADGTLSVLAITQNSDSSFVVFDIRGVAAFLVEEGPISGGVIIGDGTNLGLEAPAVPNQSLLIGNLDSTQLAFGAFANPRFGENSTLLLDVLFNGFINPISDPALQYSTSNILTFAFALQGFEPGETQTLSSWSVIAGTGPALDPGPGPGSEIPEPSTVFLTCAGVLAIVGLRRRKGDCRGISSSISN